MNAPYHAESMAIVEQLDKVQELWDKALEKAAENASTAGQKNNTAENGSVQKMAWDEKEFGQEVQAWFDKTPVEDRRKNPGYFKVGTTSEPLKSIGVKDSDVFWGRSKMQKILDDHATEGITLEMLKQVPGILEDPIVILKSETVPGSIVLFGDLKTDSGRNVMSSMTLTPNRGGSLNAEFSVITGVYSRRDGNVKGLFNKSEILYIDPSENKKRAESWLMQLGVQFPSRQPPLGSIGKVSYEGNNVKIEGKTWSEIVSETDSAQESKTQKQVWSDESYEQAVNSGDMDAAQRMVDQAAKDAGYTVKAYHGTPNGTFTTFKDWQYFTQEKWYADRYQNQGASSNGYKKTADNPKTYEVYLKPENAFDTRKARDRKIFMNEFYQQWGNGAPLSERNLPDWTDGDDFIEFFEENGYDYDAIYLDEGKTGGYGEEVKDRGISIVIKDSAQIKSADPVTYDDNGKIIPLSERFKEENRDIRYQKWTNETDPDTADERRGRARTYQAIQADERVLKDTVKRLNKQIEKMQKAEEAIQIKERTKRKVYLQKLYNTQSGRRMTAFETR